GIDAPQGNFRLVISCGSRRSDTPVMQLAGQFGQKLVAALVHRGFPLAIQDLLDPDFDKPPRKALRQEIRRKDGASSLTQQPGERAKIWQEIDLYRQTWLPIGRSLQDDGAAESTMREQEVFSKAFFIASHLHVDANPGKAFETVELLWREDQRNQCRA